MRSRHERPGADQAEQRAGGVGEVFDRGHSAGGSDLGHARWWRGSLSGWRGRRCQAVRAVLVVMLAELVELGLELCGGPGGRPGDEPALQGLVGPLDLRLGLGAAGESVLLPDRKQREQVFDALRPPVNRDV